MLNLRDIMALLLALGSAGCSTTSHRGAPAASEVVTLAPPSSIAPPPATAPVVSKPALNRAVAHRPAADPADFWISLDEWTLANRFQKPALLGAGPQPAFAVQGPFGKVILRVGTRSAVWEGLEIRLGYAPQMINDQAVLHRLDLRKTVGPLLTGSGSFRVAAKPTIVIDPGHGGSDAGTKSVLGSEPEKAFTLDWAMRTRDLLAAAGWNVHLTRTRDVDMTLSDRVAFADRHNADLFISLHFNSVAPNQTESGLETYCLTPSGLPSNLTRGYEDDLTQVWPNNAFDEQNLHVGVSLHRALLRATGGPDRGLRRARFLGVLRNQNRPAVLIEAGYLSNPRQAGQIASAAYRQTLAEALAAALRGDLRVATTSVRTRGNSEGR